MDYVSEIGYSLAEDGTGDLLLGQFEDGFETDEIRMTRHVALQLAWAILDVYTLEETNV